MKHLHKAYELLFGEPHAKDLKDWEIAKAVIDNFDGSKLDEVTARDALEFVIVDVVFPDNKITQEVVQKAENLLPEVSNDYSSLVDIHMAVVERVRWQRQNK